MRSHRPLLQGVRYGPECLDGLFDRVGAIIRADVERARAIAAGRRWGKSALVEAQALPSEHVNDPILRGVSG